MKLIALYVYVLHFFISDFASCWIFSTIQTAFYFQSFCRGRPGDEINDRFVIP